jgi:NAD(P)-dependent dehydrogenase (short-subunit alcohol dehydrogenase family)
LHPVELERFAHRDDPGVHVTVGQDLRDEAAVTTLYAGLPALWASVNIAGGFAMAPLLDTSLADLQRMLDLNLVTAFLSCREAVRAIRRSGGQGRLVNVAARPAVAPTPGMVAYATAKAGVAALTQALAEELASEGIFVNAVLPSIINTPANRAAMPAADPTRWPTPAGIAATIAFLASPANATTRGGLVPVFGRA